MAKKSDIAKSSELDATSVTPTEAAAQEAVDAEKPAGLQEFGASGLQISGGTVMEELLPELTGYRGQRIFKQMSENDGMVGAFLFALNQMIGKLEWKFEAPQDADDEELAATDFLNECLEDMSQPWDQVLEEILTFAVYGWSYFEVVYKIRRGTKQKDGSYKSKFDDGRIGWRKFAHRGQQSLLRWQLDQHENVTGMVQQTNLGTFEIPLKKALLFRITQNKNNPEGRSLLRTAYRPWFFKTRIEEYEAIGIERELAGYPVVTTPAVWHTADATADQKKSLQTAITLAKSLRRGESEGAVIPALYDQDKNKTFSIDLITSGGARQINLGEAVTRKNAEIAMSVLADFLMLGHEENGSRSLGVTKIDLWTLSVSAIAKSISTVFDRFASPQLLEFNGMTPRRTPKFVFGEINRVDLGALGPFLKILTDAGMLTPDDNLEDWGRDLIKAPKRNSDSETRGL
jgi:hypothetical protein